MSAIARTMAKALATGPRRVVLVRNMLPKTRVAMVRIRSSGSPAVMVVTTRAMAMARITMMMSAKPMMALEPASSRLAKKIR